MLVGVQVVQQLQGQWFDPWLLPAVYLKVSLGKMLNPMLPLKAVSSVCVCVYGCDVWMCEWRCKVQSEGSLRLLHNFFLIFLCCSLMLKYFHFSFSLLLLHSISHHDKSKTQIFFRTCVQYSSWILTTFAHLYLWMFCQPSLHISGQPLWGLSKSFIEFKSGLCLSCSRTLTASVMVTWLCLLSLSCWKSNLQPTLLHYLDDIRPMMSSAWFPSDMTSDWGQGVQS